MARELKVPQVGESVQEVQVGRWLVKEGQWVAADQELVEIETDKASVEVFAPAAGVVSKIIKKEGDPADVGEVIGLFEPQDQPSENGRSSAPTDSAPKAAAEPAAEQAEHDYEEVGGVRVMPSARRLLSKYGLSPQTVPATGPGGRLLQEDVLRYVKERGLEEGEKKEAAPKQQPSTSTVVAEKMPQPVSHAGDGAQREEEIVPMSLIRRRIAARLVEAQQTAALLTTFNEVDMSGVMELRKRYKDEFLQKHGVKLGFMSFFVKAAVEALKAFPAVNAEIRGNNIIYRNYYDIGVAIGSGKGLVVPALRNAELMSFADVEKNINDLASRAQENKLSPDELVGGTFTISNGGVYGSLLSTPIVNPPQSGILGMHAIQERPIAVNGQVVIRPMMYLALTYDHRIIDGREAVSFLKHIKESIEDPTRILLEV
jgi:2-oxoglutarate dehydrogenase E2 component (dihydrolipoamide succinyltransferase)